MLKTHEKSRGRSKGHTRRNEKKGGRSTGRKRGITRSACGVPPDLRRITVGNRKITE